MVKEYKYLGIWFNSKLTWGTHLDYMAEAAKKRQLSITKLLTNKRVAPRAKLLVWTSYVRPLLEYGCVVWRANEKQAQRLEAIQQRALSLILKINGKAKRESLRALAKVASLATRWSGYRLRYYARTFSYPLSRNVRVQLHDRQGPRRPHQPHWMQDIKALINGHAALRTAERALIGHVRQFGGVLPEGEVLVDPDEPTSAINPLEVFAGAVEDWMWDNEKQLLIEGGELGKTAYLLARSAGQEETWPYRTRMTRFPIGDGDKIRLRLLAGTSALNSTLHHWREERLQFCPFERCHNDEADEDVSHFCLNCPGYDGLRTAFLEGIQRDCTCGGNQSRCHVFFEGLEEADKLLFMLSMPVKGRVAERQVDLHSRTYVRNAWRLRKKALEARYQLSDSESDHDHDHDQAAQLGPLRAAFARQRAQSGAAPPALSAPLANTQQARLGPEPSHAASARQGALGEVQNGREPSVPPPLFPIFVQRTQQQRSSSPHIYVGSGSNDPTVEERT